jgi:hypothetical protein
LRKRPGKIIILLVAGFMLTSNMLAIIYLFITRILQYRSLESLLHFLGSRGD